MGILEENLPPEEIIDDGLGLLVRHKRLYHGSGAKDIKNLDPAENTTVGEGVYFTSEPASALGYAKRRAKRSSTGEPSVYGAQIENLKFLDLRNRANITKILDGFLQILLEKKKKKGLSWIEEGGLNEAIGFISSGTWINLKQITDHLTVSFTEYVKALGYDGLVTVEGGEGEEIGEHDTYLVFDAGKIGNLSDE